MGLVWRQGKAAFGSGGPLAPKASARTAAERHQKLEAEKTEPFVPVTRLSQVRRAGVWLVWETEGRQCKGEGGPASCSSTQEGGAGILGWEGSRPRSGNDAVVTLLLVLLPQSLVKMATQPLPHLPIRKPTRVRQPNLPHKTVRHGRSMTDHGRRVS